MSPRFRRFLAPISIASALSAITFVVPAAQASIFSLNACDNSALTQPFTPWADFSSYKLAPGGNFEGSLSGWALSSGAQQAPGSEPYNVGGSGSYALSLSTGATATSPQTCVNAAYPDFRFFARTNTPGSAVAVSVVSGSLTIPVGVVTLSGDWAPTLPMTTLSPILGGLGGGTANISLRFTEVSGSSQIDDVYVDPYSGH